MALCRVTGTIYLPSGEPAAGYNVYLTRASSVVVPEYLGSVVPDSIRVQAGWNGDVNFEVLSGTYSGVAGSSCGGKGFTFNFVVPDADNALFQDCLDAVVPDPPPPAWLQRVEQAVADAEAAAEMAAQAADDLSGAVDANNGMEEAVPLSDGGAAIVTLDGTGDLVRMYDDGLDLVPSSRLRNRLNIPDPFIIDDAVADEVLSIGSASTGNPDYAGGVVVEAMDGLPLRKLYPDGLDFVPSQRFLDRLPPSGQGGLKGDGWAESNDGSYTVQSSHYGVSSVDRVIDRPDGVVVAVPELNGVKRRASINSSYGQSNANVTRMRGPLMTTTAVFPYNTFMLDDMNPDGSTVYRGGMMGWQGVAASRGTRFIGASEARRDTQDYTSIAFSTELRLTESLIRRVGMIRSSALGGAKLRGDTAGQGIWVDRDGNYTQPWENWKGDIQQSHDLLVAQGYLVDEVNIHFTHQEADWQTPRATYLADFLAMKSEIEAWITATIPGVDIQWFVDQASGSALRTPKYNGGEWPVRMAICDAALPENGGANITMVMPRYWLDFGMTLAGAQDTIHHSNRARIWQGEVYGYARKEKRAGREWKCPVMKTATISGNSVIVDFDSLEPLVIDMTFCKVRSDAGFTIGNGAVVTGVRQTGQRQITVDCATTPATSISYAYRSSDPQDVLDNWPLSTGAIRDAWEAPSLFDPGKKLVRAALGYQLQL